MKDKIIREIEQSMLPHLNNAQMQQLRMALEHAFYNKSVSELDPSEAITDDSNDLALLNMFLAAKKVEGCSEKTIRYYGNTLTKMLNALDVRIAHITTDDLRTILHFISKKQRAARQTLIISAESYPASFPGWRMKTMF